MKGIFSHGHAEFVLKTTLMNKRILWTGLMLILLISALAQAAPGGVGVKRLRGNARFQGDGCPAGSVSTAESPDGSVVTLIFDRFTVSAGGPSRLKQARVYCDFTIPFQVPDGQRMRVARIDYRGFNVLAPQARSQFAVDYTFSRKRMVDFRRNFERGEQGNFVVTDKVGAKAFRWSGCGGTTELSGRAVLTIHTGPKMEESIAGLDSLDGAAVSRGGLLYEIRLAPCRGPGAPPPDEVVDP